MKKSQELLRPLDETSKPSLRTIYSGTTPGGVSVAVAEDTNYGFIFFSIGFTTITLPKSDFIDFATGVFSASVFLESKEDVARDNS